MTVPADAAFDDLFAAHHRSLFRFAVLLVGDRHVADEITAEVFTRVLPRWRSGDVTDPLPYLRRALVNEVRNRHRRRTYEQRALSRLQATGGTVEAESVQLAGPLVVALKRLPVRQRAVVVLRFHDDLSEAEVARTLGMAVGTVKSQASRGLAALREMLEDQR